MRMESQLIAFAEARSGLEMSDRDRLTMVQVDVLPPA